MHKHTETRRLLFRPDQMYALVLDIEKYPEFLPWCDALRITSHTPNTLTAQMCVGFKGITERFTSRVEYDENTHTIEVYYQDGPFKYLRNTWVFIPDGDTACGVHFNIEFEFKSKILDKIMTPFFATAVQKMVQAFEQRAKDLYS